MLAGAEGEFVDVEIPGGHGRAHVECGGDEGGGDAVCAEVLAEVVGVA